MILGDETDDPDHGVWSYNVYLLIMRTSRAVCMASSFSCLSDDTASDGEAGVSTVAALPCDAVGAAIGDAALPEGDGTVAALAEQDWSDEGKAAYANSETRIRGREGLLVDIGSVWDLAGSRWCYKMAKAADAKGMGRAHGIGPCKLQGLV